MDSSGPKPQQLHTCNVCTSLIAFTGLSCFAHDLTWQAHQLVHAGNDSASKMQRNPEVRSFYTRIRFSSYTCKCTQNGVSERDHNASLDPSLANLSSHPALTSERQISESRAVVWYEDHSYTPKEDKEEEGEEDRRTKAKFFSSIFLTVRMINGTLQVCQEIWHPVHKVYEPLEDNHSKVKQRLL